MTKEQLNKIWDAEHDDFLIPYLAELTRQRYKVDKTFKPAAFSVAARAMNKKFCTDFRGPNISNHIKSLSTRFMDMCNYFNASRAEWDEKSN